VQLDEWLGLGDQMHPASCAHYIDTHILASTVAAVRAGLPPLVGVAALLLRGTAAAANVLRGRNRLDGRWAQRVV